MVSIPSRAVIFSHPTGNANSRAAVEALFGAGLLAEFHTCVALYPGSLWSAISKTRLGTDFNRRAFPCELKAITRQQPWRELGRLIAGKFSLDRITCHERGICCVDKVYRDLDRKVAQRFRRRFFDAVYAYEDGALESFRAAKESQGKCLYDLPIGYWRAAQSLLQFEQERWPQWVATMQSFRDSEAKLSRKDQELSLADKIYVASSFTKRTLEYYPGDLAPIEVVPYGFPPVGPPRDYAITGRKLKLLYVGGLSQRKGIADVFAVADRLRDDVELTVVGRGAVDECPALAAALKRHHWIPSLSHSEVLRTMRGHDLLLFPSLFEGFGLVITEAMSQGTPVITTDRTAGADLIQQDQNGWLVEAGKGEAIMKQVEAILQNKSVIESCGQNARASATQRPWSQYGFELSQSIMRAVASLY